VPDEVTDQVLKATLNPQRFSGYVAAAWRLTRPRFLSKAIAFGVADLLLGASSILLGLSLEDKISDSTGLVFGAVLFVVLTSIGSLIAACCGLMMIREMAGSTPSFRETLRGIGSLRWSILAAGLYAGSLVLLLQVFTPALGYFVALPIPFSVLSLGPFSLGPPILLHTIAVERVPLANGWRRTSELMRGGVLRTILYLFTFSLFLYLLTGLISGGLIQLVFSALSGFPASALAVSIVALLAAIPQVFLAAALLVAYFDARSRSTDGDLSLEELENDQAPTTPDDPSEPDEAEPVPEKQPGGSRSKKRKRKK
jgi:hypothetical protein